MNTLVNLQAITFRMVWNQERVWCLRVPFLGAFELPTVLFKCWRIGLLHCCITRLTGPRPTNSEFENRTARGFDCWALSTCENTGRQVASAT